MKRFMILLFGLLLLPEMALAEPIPIGSYPIPGLVDSETEGKFVKIMFAIEQCTGLDFALAIKPPKRIRLEFKEQTLSGYFPELEQLKEPACRTESFVEKNIIVVTRKDAPPVTSVKDLEGKRVGAVIGYSYGKEVTDNPNIKLYYVNTDYANIENLLKGHIEVIIGDVLATVNAIKASGKEDQLVYDAAHPLITLEAVYVFQNTEAGKALCEQVSEALRSMKADGTLQNILAGKE